MVRAISGFRPYVSVVPTVTQQQRVNQIKLERNEVTDDLRNGKISDMQAMSERVDLESQLMDARAKVASASNGIDVVGVDRTPKSSDVVTAPREVTKSATVNNVERQQKGKELSNVEKQNIVEQQMNQMAINNQVLHGLIAV